MIYNPLNWYWLRDDGAIYSSASQCLVTTTNVEYKAWVKAGGAASRWPEDTEGQQTDASLLDVISVYGLDISPDVIEAARRRKITELSKACAAAIVGGYESDALGVVHQYPSKQTDQLNMMGSVTDALTPGKPENWKTPFWCADASGLWAFRDHSATEIISAGQDGKAHVVNCQSRLAGLNVEVHNAATVEDIEVIVWDT
ncbi:hypothetical protein DXT97_12350 [Agrobacterium tumefaciens]|uniref:DUF4376 domain-containing protein n=1 Tax=Agrobacterium tumefaciens TaxID=358 RepID=UPI001294B858|nr:hypothetical protein [Agrobacterium tumefaciens]MQB37582.1 hypothetical protein [Agrobacterium tumefaciens]